MREKLKIQRKMDHRQSHGLDSEAPNSVGVWSLKIYILLPPTTHYMTMI